MPAITIDLNADELGAALLLSVIGLAWEEAPIPTPLEAIGLMPEEPILEMLDDESEIQIRAFGQGLMFDEISTGKLDPSFDMLRDLTVMGQCYYVSTLMKAHLEHFRYTPEGSDLLANLLSALRGFGDPHMQEMSEKQIEAIGLFLQYCLVFDANDPKLVEVSMKWADFVEVAAR